MMRKKYYLVALLIVVMDHITKWLSSAALIYHPVEIIPGYLRLSLVHNPGVAFGLFAGYGSAWKPHLLGAMAVIALIAIFLYSRRMPSDRHLLQWALTITTGGILGNLIDRIFRGYVVDFIEFHIHDSFYWPNFNIADSSITIGIALLLIDTVRNPGIDEVAKPAAGSRT
jgi:signal peptidase II